MLSRAGLVGFFLILGVFWVSVAVAVIARVVVELNAAIGRHRGAR